MNECVNECESAEIITLYFKTTNDFFYYTILTEARVPVGDPFPKESLDMASKHLDHKPHLSQLPRMRGSHLHHEPHPRGSLNMSGKGLHQDSHRKSAPSKLLYHEPHKKESSNSTGKSLGVDPRVERSPNKQVTDHGDIRDSTTDDSYDHLQRA